MDHTLRIEYPEHGHQYRHAHVVHDGQRTDIPIHGLPISVTVLPCHVKHSGHIRKLCDARSLNLVGALPWYPQCYIPSARTLAEVLLDIVAHGETHPTHGYNCICMDQYSYELRRHLDRALPEVVRVPDPHDPDNWRYDEQTWKANCAARNRISHVFRMLSKRL